MTARIEQSLQAIAAQPQRAPNGAPVHYERHRPEQTTLYRLVQQHAATFIAQAEDAAGADLPQFVKDEFDAFLECGINLRRFAVELTVWPAYITQAERGDGFAEVARAVLAAWGRGSGQA